MDELIAIVLFLVLGGCISLPVYLNYKAREKELETVIKLAERGADMQSLLNSMLTRRDTSRSDLRKGLLMIAVALPLIVFGISEGEAYIALIFGGIPLLVGLAYLTMAKSQKTASQDIES